MEAYHINIVSSKLLYLHTVPSQLFSLRYLMYILGNVLCLDVLFYIQWQHPTDQTLYRTRPFTEFWVVSIEYLRWVWHAGRGRLLLRTPGPVPLGLAYILLVETNPIPNLSLFFRTMLFEYPSVLSRFCLCVVKY